MRNGRSPCCDKDLVKRGPWSPAEDLKLVTFIQKYGHQNWRALPRQAGLLRCGKSCRLRWVNYLRPDLKRGNFSKEEVETIMKLHEALGNKWSTIASHLPGRTDNEIKNVWNTHLKKKLACKKILESASDMQAFQGAAIKEPEQDLVNQGSSELVDITKNPNQSSSSSAGTVSSVKSNYLNADNMDAYKPEQQMSYPLFKHFEPYDVEKPSKEAYQLNSAVVETPMVADCDFWNFFDNIPNMSNEIQLCQDHNIHNQPFIQENVHYVETIKYHHGMGNEFRSDATNAANKDQWFQKNNTIESEIKPCAFGYDEMTMVEPDSDLDLGYVQWYSSWPQNPSF